MTGRLVACFSFGNGGLPKRPRARPGAHVSPVVDNSPQAPCPSLPPLPSSLLSGECPPPTAHSRPSCGAASSVSAGRALTDRKPSACQEPAKRSRHVRGSGTEKSPLVSVWVSRGPCGHHRQKETVGGGVSSQTAELDPSRVSWYLGALTHLCLAEQQAPRLSAVSCISARFAVSYILVCFCALHSSSAFLIPLVVLHERKQPPKQSGTFRLVGSPGSNGMWLVTQGLDELNCLQSQSFP